MFEPKILSILCFTGQLRHEDFLEGRKSLFAAEQQLQKYKEFNLILL